MTAPPPRNKNPEPRSNKIAEAIAIFIVFCIANYGGLTLIYPAKLRDNIADREITSPAFLKILHGYQKLTRKKVQ